MATIQWGRKETIIFPPHNPIYSYGAVFLALVLTGFFVFLRFWFGQLPLQQYYTPILFARQQVRPSTRRTSSNCSTSATERKQFAWQSKTTCRKARRPRREERTFRWRSRERPKRKAIESHSRAPLQYKDAPLHEYLRNAIYNGDEFRKIYELPLLFGLLSLVLQLPFSVRKDIKRRKQMRYGRRLKGPKRFTRKSQPQGARRWNWHQNRRSNGDASHPSQG